MTEKTFVAGKEFVTALANRAFRQGRGRVSLRSPLIGPPLLEVDRDFKASSVIGHDAFIWARKLAVRGDPAADEEMPNWNDLTLALMASGAVPPRNFGDFLKWLRELEDEARDPRRYTTPVALAIDANIAYCRLFSRHLAPVHDPSRGLTVLVSEGVRDEIGHHTGKKIGPAELRRLYTAPGHAPYVDELSNRYSLETRRARLAQNEIDHLTKLGASTAPCAKYQGGTDFDVEIAKSYQAFSNDRKIAAHVLTFDANMGRHAKDLGLPRFNLQWPDEGRFAGSSLEMAFPAVVHDLAVLFGVLTVEHFGVLIWGEWGGKTSEDYEGEQLRIQIDSSQPVAGPFSRDVELGRALVNESAKWAR